MSGIGSDRFEFWQFTAVLTQMSLRLFTDAGPETTIPALFLKQMSLFTRSPELADSGSYQLRCKVTQAVLNAFVRKLYDQNALVEVTYDNFEQLDSLCRELGFSGFDKELQAFTEAVPREDAFDVREVLLLKERVMRHDKRLAEIQHQLNELLSWKQENKSSARDFQSLERRIDEIVLLCGAAQTTEVSQKTEPKDHAKRKDIEKVARGVAQLKESEATSHARTVKSSDVMKTTLPPLNPETAVKQVANKRHRRKVIPLLKQRREFLYDESKPLEGIIAHLTRECGGDVHRKGIVNITASSVRVRSPVNRIGGPGPGLVLEQFCPTGMENEFNFCSKNERNAWICYDFKERRVIPTSYSVRSSGGKNLKSWVIEVSNDEYSWTEIDRRDNNNDLNDEYVTVNFKISKVPSESFRFFRLRQNGPNHDNYKTSYAVALTALEVFGTLFVMEKIDRPEPRQRTFVYQIDKEGLVPPPLLPAKLDGIIAQLTRECDGNPHDKGVVNVISSSTNTVAHPKCAADLWTNSPYMSVCENDWICYDFIERRVIPTSYSVRSGQCWRQGFTEDEHLKSWVIEVSNDGYSWTEIDRQDNNDLNGKYATANFKISRIPSESFQFFRLRQTGKNHQGTDGFRITALEIFGTLSVSDKIERPEPRQRTFVYQTKELFPPPLYPPEFDGIIAQLTRECGGNVHDKGVVSVMASTYGADVCLHPKNAADLLTGLAFQSDDYLKQDQWICYDFRERRVIPTRYSMRWPLKSWVIEVSNDGYLWTEIHRGNNSYEQSEKGKIANFKISRVPSESFRFFRLRQIGKTYYDTYQLRVYALEIFGTLVVTEKINQPQPKREFMYQSGNEVRCPPPLFPPKFDGIVAHLTRECGGNVHDKGIINVTASSACPDAPLKMSPISGNTRTSPFKARTSGSALISKDGA